MPASKGKFAGWDVLSLTQPVKQRYRKGLNGHFLKEVQRGDVKNMNLLSKNISSPS